VSYDTDAQTYITAVETADGSALPAYVKNAVDAFVVGCKSDGIWSALKAACFLAGPATLNGALVPLVGTAPTNNNFVSGDYNQITGLVGDGATKYLDSNRLRTDDPANSFHLTTHVSVLHPLGTLCFYAGAGLENNNAATGFTTLSRFSNGPHAVRNTASLNTSIGQGVIGFFGTSRSEAASFTHRHNSTTGTVIASSEALPASTTKVFAGRLLFGSPNAPTAGRLAWYSIGESLDLALLDTRVSAYMAAIAAGPTTVQSRRRRSMGGYGL
jgi:hypothetical protein